jgi:hypothetical protein
MSRAAVGRVITLRAGLDTDGVGFGSRRMWQAADVAQIDLSTDVIVGAWLTVPDVAERLNLPVSRVKQMLRDRKLLAVQRPNGEFAIPAGFLDGDQVIHGLGGTLTLLYDCGFSDPEALSWLFTADDTLPGTPVQALTEHRRTEVNRRAQALAF